MILRAPYGSVVASDCAPARNVGGLDSLESAYARMSVKLSSPCLCLTVNGPRGFDLWEEVSACGRSKREPLEASCSNIRSTHQPTRGHLEHAPSPVKCGGWREQC